MRKNNSWPILFTLFFASMAVYFLYPSIVLYQKDPEVQRKEINSSPDLRKKIINLGLDLQGGMRLVLEVDRSEVPKEAQKDLLDRAYTIIENRINGLGLTEPIIQKQGNDRLIIELPGLNDEKVAKEVIGSTAQLKFHVVREDILRDKAIQTVDKALRGVTETKEVVTDKSAESAEVKTAENIFAGSDDASTEVETVDSAVASDTETETVEVNISKMSEYLMPMGSDLVVLEKNRVKVQEILDNEKVTLALKKEFSRSMFAWGHDLTAVPNSNDKYRAIYFIKKQEAMSGETIETANSDVARGGFSAGSAVVSLKFNSKGARKFSRVTARNIDNRLAIVLDNTVYSAPSINEKISMGSAQISGSFTMDEAKNLAVVLQAGALPAPVEIIEERTIGPSLGRDSIQKATYAAIIGFGLVMLFMAIYYKGAGILAILALFMNVIFVLAIMASFGATLTLPGIAGLILIMGMSVDANVIIFERIKEELKLGKGVVTSIDAGYDRAFVTIMDANITTLFTAIVLYNVGSGPIRGFAITMIFGIMVSLFTALTFTKMVFHLLTASGKVKKLSI